MLSLSLRFLLVRSERGETGTAGGFELLGLGGGGPETSLDFRLVAWVES